MKTKILSFAVMFLFLTGLLNCAIAQNTYTIGGTTFYSNQTYKTTGLPKVNRSEANKSAFLKSHGYSSVPDGYEVDHIIPLSQGGADTPGNMQLLTIEQHRAKTARERASSNYNNLPKYNYSTYKSKSPTHTAPRTYNYKSASTNNYTPTSSYNYSSGKTIYTGSRGGKYYINSNGNKTYVKH